MYQILRAEQLADKIFLMEVEAPRVARACEPGEFVIVKMDEIGERIPLTICDYDREKGTITIVFQIVGASTERMSAMKAGDAFQDFVGPLGRPSEFVNEDVNELKNKKFLFVAGGVGAAPVYPQVKWMKEHGIDVDVVVGAKNKDLIILEDEMKAVAGNLYITTDDGSYQRKGMVTAVVEDLVKNNSGSKRWKGPYLKGGVIPQDPWGNDYIYKKPGDHGEFDIISYGADGQPGGEDEDADIGNWTVVEEE